MKFSKVHRELPSEWGHQSVVLPVSWCRHAPGRDPVIKRDQVRTKGMGRLQQHHVSSTSTAVKKAAVPDMLQEHPKVMGRGWFGFQSLF